MNCVPHCLSVLFLTLLCVATPSWGADIQAPAAYRGALPLRKVAGAHAFTVSEREIFRDNAKDGRSGHMGHALVDCGRGRILDFCSNCDGNRCAGHSGYGWMEYRVSTDWGRTFGPVRVLDYSKRLYGQGRHTALCEKGVCLKDGRIVLFFQITDQSQPICCEPWSPSTYVVSSDGGETWSEARPTGAKAGRIYDAVTHGDEVFFLVQENPHFLGTAPEHVYRVYHAGPDLAFTGVTLPVDARGKGYGALEFAADGALHAYVYDSACETEMDCTVSRDLGRTWEPVRRTRVAKRIRNPQIRRLDDTWFCVGRNGGVKGGDGLVLYASADGLDWDEGVKVDERPAGQGTGYYSCLLPIHEPGRPPRLLLQYSHPYSVHRVNVAHRTIEFAPPAGAGAVQGKGAGRTMCLGDSITHFGFTEYYLQLFENLRHPGSGLRYYNAGYSGGHVSTGLANWEHERTRIRPDRVFAMFGMNDVLWTTFETNATLSAARKAAVDGAMDRYRNDYRTLVDRVRASGVTNLVLVTPSPYDEYSVKLASERKRNVNDYGLTKAARIVREVAAEKCVPVVDIHAAMTDLCRKFPDQGLCGGDRVHPPRLGHLFMAFQYLAAEKDRPVASVSLAADGKVLRRENAVVDNVRAQDGVLAFDYAPKALPLPPLEEFATLKKLWPDAAHFNRESLAVTGLSGATRWSLRAEGRELGVFSAAELAAGVNLADLDTPGRRVAAEAAAAMTALHDFDRPRRDRACLRRNFESFGIPMTDKAALKAAYDKRLADLKAQKVHWYEWERAASADFLAALDRGPEIAAEEERLYRALAAVRPAKCRLSILPVKEDGTLAGGDALDHIDYERLVERAKAAPTLLFTAEKRDAARARIAADPAAKAWWTKFRTDLDKRMAKCPAIPPVGGQWFHWYACPKCGVHLKGETPTRHVCSKCRGVYSGWPYDDAYYFFIHHGLGELVRDCGLAGALSGDAKYADLVRKILLGYADAYLTYPRHDNSGPTEKNRDAARAFSQILDESVWLIDLLQGYDAVAGSIPESDCRTVRERVFRPAADIIHAVDDQPRHILGNHQCWHFCAYALAALVTGDAARLRESMEGLSGCRYQLETGILSDGFWYEGAWGYHFYTMGSLMPYFAALNNLGVSPPARFKKMFDAPFGQLTPDWKLPAMNDSGRVSFTPGTRAEFYEQAWSWWRDPVYAGWLALKPRTTLHYALYGEPLPEKGAPLTLKSRLYEASGVSVLRNGGNYVLMDHGPHGGWHGHYDKLNLLVWAQGAMFAEDPGCIGYGLPLHWAWYKNSLSHNTLSVDGRQAAADGRLLAFNGAGDVQYVTADAGNIAKGVQVRRATALWGDLLFDYVAATSADEHLYEWTFHSRGALETSVPATPVPLTRPDIVCRKQKDAETLTRDADPWAWTEDCRDGAHSGAWHAKWTLKGGQSLALFQRSAAGTLRTSTGGAQPPSQSFRVTGNRVRAKSAAFATVMLLDGRGTAEVELLPSDGGAPRFAATVGGRRLVCRIAPDWSSLSISEE